MIQSVLPQQGLRERPLRSDASTWAVPGHRLF